MYSTMIRGRRFGSSRLWHGADLTEDTDALPERPEIKEHLIVVEVHYQSKSVIGIERGLLRPRPEDHIGRFL